MSTSDFLENKTLDHNIGTTAFVSPTLTALVLFTADPTDAYIVANEVDTTVDDTAYVRQTIEWNAAAGGVAANTNAETFPAVVFGTGGVPYTVTHFGITDSLTYQGGNLLYHGPLDAPVLRNAGVPLIFGAGSIKITQT